MNRYLKENITRFFGKFDVGLTTYSNLMRLQQCSKKAVILDFILAMPEQHLADLVHNLDYSNAQILQDLFVLSELDFKTGGYFVEFGATNGVDINNTSLLEKNFDWTGIVAEPCKKWHNDLQVNRGCNIELDCVWSKTGDTLQFVEAEDAELSTVHQLSGKDIHGAERLVGGTSYPVKTISLNDLLRKYNAPAKMDYLSIDTEGSELEILSSLNFDEFEFSVITCEHNYTSDREKIFSLLTKNGYQRKFEALSHFDDWYTKEA